MKPEKMCREMKNEIINRLFLRFDGMISVDSRQMPSAMEARMLEVIDGKIDKLLALRNL